MTLHRRPAPQTPRHGGQKPKAAVAAKLDELVIEITLAVSQGASGDQFTWTQTFVPKDPDEPWIAVLTVAKV
jgi:hypothetical protein